MRRTRDAGTYFTTMDYMVIMSFTALFLMMLSSRYSG
jgi:hypothetical protein